MASLYWSKLTLAGSDIDRYSSRPIDGLFFSIARFPVSLVEHGAVRCAMLGVLTLASWWFVRRWKGAPALLVSLTFGIALLLRLETALIPIYFYITHGAASLLFAIAVGLVFCRAAIDGLAALAPTLQRRAALSHGPGEASL